MTYSGRLVRHGARGRDGQGVSAAGVAGIVWVGLALALWLAVDVPAYLAWLIAGGLATFVLFAFDKLRSKQNGWRVPERALLGFVLLGGVAGGWLGMRWLRHKTLHRQFWIVLWLATVLHLAILGWSLLA